MIRFIFFVLLFHASYVQCAPDRSNESKEKGFSWKCMACRGGVEVLRFLFERNSTSDKIIRAAEYFCKEFANQNTQICKGLTSQFREQFLYVLEQMVLSPRQFCGLMLDECGIPNNPFDGNWTLNLPPKPDIFKDRPAKQADQENRPIFRVLQVSDLHFDFEYENGTEADCGKPVCCQGAPVPVPKKSAGYWGTLAACDIPLRTVESMFAHIAGTHMTDSDKKIDYIMLTGDYMPHNDWVYNKDSHLYVISNLTQLINTYFPDTPVFWGVGNHEGVPVNSFAPHTMPSRFWPDWIYKALTDAGERWIPPEQIASANFRGSFSVKLTDKLKLINLNTNFCETTNFFLYLNQTDPDSALQWLIEELKEAEEQGVVVHIMAHIPPGDGECLEGWARNYYRIVNRFEYTIRAQFFGHVHTDSFTVFYENMNNFHSRPTNVLYSAPSVTTFESVNPAYRIYEVDGNYEHSTYEILDYKTYFLNLSRPQPYPNPEWELLYSAKAEYNLPDLSASSWSTLGERIRGDDVLYKKFLKNYARRDDYPCDAKCRDELLCSLRRGHHNESALCPESTLIKRTFPFIDRSNIEPSILDQFTRDEFISGAKTALWNKVVGWIGK
ncbi:unnamed protein product [Bursaphelenchus xylophilus]|uniref:Sphingomyelin phosphodiesterase n=1 Tax=Bursaphelenchus xylophilus TaxID=6326 RepID=A0A1I7SMC9_BURXY|nr:unnamed protein product [Bursaphelenchus xylophilus]CAG9130120.1 unnamed protein product [Bursaphelenchus xylophilus]